MRILDNKKSAVTAAKVYAAYYLCLFLGAFPLSALVLGKSMTPLLSAFFLTASLLALPLLTLFEALLTGLGRLYILPLLGGCVPALVAFVLADSALEKKHYPLFQVESWWWANYLVVLMVPLAMALMVFIDYSAVTRGKLFMLHLPRFAEPGGNRWGDSWASAWENTETDTESDTAANTGSNEDNIDSALVKAVLHGRVLTMALLGFVLIVLFVGMTKPSAYYSSYSPLDPKVLFIALATVIILARQFLKQAGRLDFLLIGFTGYLFLLKFSSFTLVLRRLRKAATALLLLPMLAVSIWLLIAGGPIDMDSYLAWVTFILGFALSFFVPLGVFRRIKDLCESGQKADSAALRRLAS